MVRREESDFDPVRGSKLVEDVRDMPLDGAEADRGLLRNFLVREAVDNGPHNLELATRQPEGLRAPAGEVELAQTASHIGNTVVADPVLTLHHAVNTGSATTRSEEHTSELQSHSDLV